MGAITTLLMAVNHRYCKTSEIQRVFAHARTGLAVNYMIYMKKKQLYGDVTFKSMRMGQTGNVLKIMRLHVFDKYRECKFEVWDVESN